MNNKKPNLIVDLSFQFSLSIIEYTAELDKRNKYVLSNQLLRSGTSIGVNIAESQNADSKIEFLYNIQTALKEVSDTKYWLNLCKESEEYPDCKRLLDEIGSIERVATKIIKSLKKNN